MEDFISIQDSFSIDQLFHVSASSLPWFIDYVNFLLGQVLQSNSSPQQKKKFSYDPTIIGMTLTFLESVMIRSLEDMFQKQRCKKFYITVILYIMVDILEDKGQQ